MALVWDEQKCLLLLEEYEKVPMLWDVNHPEYFTASKTESWTKLALALGYQEEDEVKQLAVNRALRFKIQGLRRTFKNETKKEKRSIEAIIGAREVYKSNWYAFKKMHFLSDRKYGPRQTLDSEQGGPTDFSNNAANGFQNNPLLGPNNNLHDVNVATACSVIQGVQTTKSPEIPNANPQILRTSNTGIENPVNTGPKHDAGGTKRRSSTTASHSRKHSKSEKKLSKLLMKHVNASALPADDTYDCFGKLVAKTLRKMEKQTATRVQYLMNTILYHSEMGNSENILINTFRGTHIPVQYSR